MNKIKTKREIYNAFKPYMQNVRIFRTGINDYGEKEDDLFVTEIEGYYSLGKNLIAINYTDGGAINSNYNEMLSVMVDKESKKIQKDDYFNLNDVKFRIVHIQNVMDIYLDLTLERV